MSADADREARFTRWLDEHRGILFRVARAYAAEPESQADLLQEMRLQLWRSLANFRAEAKPSTWIYRICLNTALTWRRGENRRQRLAGTDAADEVASLEPRPGWSQEEAELVGRLYGAIRELAPPERSLVLLTLDGLSYREIAEIVGLTENHVGVALNRARAKLATRLKGVRDEL